MVSDFDDVLAAAHLPPPGPEYYNARRALWLTPNPVLPPRAQEPSSSRRKLEQVLNSPTRSTTTASDQTWPTGAIAPEPDDELYDIPAAPIIYPTSTQTDPSSGMTTPWTLVGGPEDEERTTGLAGSGR
ncbi:hypothetical protein B0H10DRAFT_2428685 [Mycena sp. CBHHK59/15]|nr:hypothetical protein B0H10DRAFT_2428685 [Mycena sp. CBHHK59/15]